ncbi:MAG: hypothetical protein WDN06_03680 [Asticcacaulis sp.]
MLVSEDLDHSDNRINPFFLPLIGSILDYAAGKDVDVLMSLQKPPTGGRTTAFHAGPTALSSSAIAISKATSARSRCCAMSASLGWCSGR